MAAGDLYSDASARPPLRPSEPPLCVFVSSVMDEEMAEARRITVNTIDAAHSMLAWAFECTPPSSEGAAATYLRRVREADFVVWLAGSRLTQPVEAEVREALAAERPRVLAIRLGARPRERAVTHLVEEVRKHAKTTDASTLDQLAEAVRMAIGDEIAIALRTKPGLERRGLLNQLHQESLGRCLARWQAAGLARRPALALAEDPRFGVVADELFPDSAHPLVLWTAELGSGKTIAGERAYQHALRRLRDDPIAPVPIYLPASEARPRLDEAVRAASEGLGDVSRQGASIIVDGLDELGMDASAQVLTQARALVTAWPSTTVVLTSRPSNSYAGVEEQRRLPELSRAERDLCVELAAEREIRPAVLNSMSNEVRASMHRPLFALLVGVWLRDRQGVPGAPVELLAFLGERSAQQASLDSAVLRRLAVLSVSRDLAPVPNAEVGTPTELAQAEATGTLVRRGGGVVFALPVLAQWFASQALARGEVTTDELLGASEDLELWRYPVALHLAACSSGAAKTLMGSLLARSPGFALRVIGTALTQSASRGSAAPPWREAGRQLRGALQALADAFGPAAPLVAEVDENGRILPLAVSSSEGYVNASYWHGAASRPPVFAMTADHNPFAPGPGWGSSRGSAIGPTATWAWRWALDDLRDDSERLLRYRGIPVPPTGPLADEEVWATALDLFDTPPLVTDNLPLDELIKALHS